MRILAVVAIVALVGSGSGFAAGDPAKGKTHYQTCVACHGVSGEGVEAQNAPVLAGQLGSYLERQLLNFRSGARGAHPDDPFGALMSNFAKLLPDEQAVKDVVAYIETF